MFFNTFWIVIDDFECASVQPVVDTRAPEHARDGPELDCIRTIAVVRGSVVRRHASIAGSSFPNVLRRVSLAPAHIFIYLYRTRQQPIEVRENRYVSYKK